MGSTDDPITVVPARAGRPRATQRAYKPQELVRVEVRMPASVAAALFERAAHDQAPVSRTASDLLAQALAGSEEATTT